MVPPARSESLQEFVNRVRAGGDVPVGYLYFAMETQQFRLALADGLTPEEARALLEKGGLCFEVSE